MRRTQSGNETGAVRSAVRTPSPMARLSRAGAALVLAVVASACAIGPALGQPYPSKPVRIVVPAPAGGLSDVVARTLSQHLGDKFGQTFIVENRAGANGTIGIDHVAKSPADGYTLLVYPSLFVITPMLLKKVPYDAISDFTPVSLVGTIPLVVAVNPAVPASNLREFIALAKAQPEKYGSFATASIGAAGHLTTERLAQAAGLKVLVVPYKGAAPAVVDLIGGRVSAMIDPISGFIEHIKAGKLRALAVTTRDRIAALPDVPTLAESGLPGFEERSWYGLWGPAKMPREVVETLNREVAEALKTARVADRLSASGMIPSAPTSPEEFGAFMRAEIAKYSKVIKDANIKVED